jgi:hypothetical protein
MLDHSGSGCQRKEGYGTGPHFKSDRMVKTNIELEGKKFGSAICRKTINLPHKSFAGMNVRMIFCVPNLTNCIGLVAIRVYIVF